LLTNWQVSTIARARIKKSAPARSVYPVTCIFIDLILLNIKI
jgi:hypothetical protein